MAIGIMLIAAMVLLVVIVVAVIGIYSGKR